jgi:amino acid adenylation domain-containing protein
MLIEKFEKQAKKFEHNIAVKVENEEITYGRLNAMADCVAGEIRQLQDRLKGRTQAGLLFEHGPGMIVSLLGTLKAGMVYVPLDISYPEKRLLYMVENSESSVIITNARNLDLALRLSEQAEETVHVLNIDTFKDKDSPSQAAPPRKSAGDSLAYILYTSGSTGLPKGVLQTQRNVWYYTRNWAERFGIVPGDRMTLLTAFSHDGAMQDIFSALLYGAVLYPYDIKNAVNRTDLAKFPADEKITIWHSVPTLFRYFADMLGADTEQAVRFPHLRYILLGGEPLRKRDVEIVSRYFPTSILANVYGQTESSVDTIHLISPGDSYEKSLLGEPLDRTEIFLVDEDGEEVEDLGVGEIVVACDHIAPGYWKAPEATTERFTDDPDIGRLYWTGDLGRLLADGSIEMLGRKDFQVKIRGFRVETGEIETALLSHSAVRETAVVIKFDANDEPFLCAYFTADGEVHVSELRQYLIARLPDYMVPSHFSRLETMPLTATGKVDRKALPEPGRSELAEPFAAPGDMIEETVRRIWSEALGMNEMDIGIDADFFQLGGHSLKAVTVSLKIHQALEVRVELPDFFARPTIRKLAEFIRDAEKEVFHAIEEAEERDYYPLTSAQKRLFILQGMEPSNTGYHLPSMVVLEGNLSRQKVVETFQALVDRHESLRTSFLMKDGEPVQRIHEPQDIQFSVEFSNLDSPLPLISEFIRPFDLSKAPLLRVELVQLEEDKHLLMMDVHHIITDGTSRGILFEDFMALYEGRALPPPEVRCRDYALWRSRPRQQAVLEKQKNYWLDVFAGDIPQLDLPLDFPRPSIQSFEGGGFDFVLETADTAALGRLAMENNVTLYAVLLALYNILLAKLSGQEDIIIGTPTAGRGHAELQRLVGMFVNTLALRNFPRAEKTVSEFIKEVGDGALRAFENQDYPFEELVALLPIPRDAGRNPLFDTAFVLQNMDIPAVDIPGLKLMPYDYENPVSRFDITLQGFETKGRLFFQFEYCTRLFKEETLQRFSGYFKQLVTGVLERPDAVIGAVDIMSAEERQRVLVDFNHTAADYPRDKTIERLFEEQAAKSPDRVAVVTHRTNRTYKTYMTYSQLNQESNRLAQILHSKGVGSGAVVGIMVERSLEMVIGILAILKAGGVYMPIDTGYPEARVRYMMEDGNAKLLLTIDDIVGARHSVPTTGNLQPAVNPERNAYVMYTSGTTGKPKGTIINHRNVIRLIKNSNYITLDEGTRILQTGAPVFDAVTFEMWGPLLNGGLLVLTGTDVILDGHRLEEALTAYKVNTLWLSSPLFNQLAQQNIDLFAPLTYLLVGGDVLSPPHINRVRSRFPGLRIINGYGPTENTTFSTTHLIEKDYVHNIPIGRPIANSTAYILNREGHVQPIGVWGELYVGGDGVSPGYLNNPELSAEKFDQNKTKVFGGPGTFFLKKGSWPPEARLYRTGDLARWLPDGNIEFLGRIDNQVKIRGFRVELGEIDARLLWHEAVREAVVLSRNGSLCAYIVMEPGLSAQKELRDYLALNLPDYMVPSYFVELEKLPLTPNGKVDRKALPAPVIETGANYTAPRGETEEKLAAIFSRLLQVETEKIGINHNFFDLGGNSLTVVKLAAEIHREFQVPIPVMQLFKNPKIEEIAKHLANKEHINGEDESYLLLNNGKSGNLFCFPPGVGYGIAYKEFSTHYRERSVYAFNFIENKGRMQKYLEIITRVQPEGPYTLLGASAGGELALEVTRHLEAQGHQVDKIILLDSFIGPRKKEPDGEFFQGFLDQIRTAVKNLDAEFLEDEVTRKAKNYRSYLDSLPQMISVNADIFLVTAEDRKTPETRESFRLEALSRKGYVVLNGAGTHFKMLEPGYVETNARIVKEILE